MTDSFDNRNSSFSIPRVWAYLLQKPNPWGGDNRPLYKLYASARRNGEVRVSNVEYPRSRRKFVIRNSSFKIPHACTVVERDKASEGLLASGDERMEKLIEFRETLLLYQDPANGKRDPKRKNGSDGPRGIRHKKAQRSQRTLRSVCSFAASPFRTPHSEFRIRPANRLRELHEEVAAEKGIHADTLRRLLAKVDEYSESHRAFGLPDDLLNILKEDLAEHGELVFN